MTANHTIYFRCDAGACDVSVEAHSEQPMTFAMRIKPAWKLLFAKETKG